VRRRQHCYFKQEADHTELEALMDQGADLSLSEKLKEKSSLKKDTN